jgi:hypothetical protein
MNRLYYRALLENRVRKLERLIYEKTVGRGGGDSRAYTIWKLLRDEGPMTRPAIRNRLGYTTPIVEMEQEGCVFKNGNMYSYNPDYNWEDSGVLPRTAQQEAQMEIAAQMNAGDMPDEDEVAAEEPATSTRRGRTPRAPREPRVRQTRANIFSSKLDEVKAAVESGVDVNSANNSGTPAIVLAVKRKNGDPAIVEYLLEHGANPNAMDGKRPIIVTACVNNNSAMIKSLVAHGANLNNVAYKRYSILEFAVISGVRDDALVALAAGRPRYMDDWIGFNLIDAHGRGSISDDVYRRVVEKALEVAGATPISNIISSGKLCRDLGFGSTVLLDIYRGHGVMPALYRGYIFGNLSNNILNAIYNACEEVTRGQLKVTDVNNFVSVCRAVSAKLHRPDIGLSFITPEWLRENSDAADGVIMLAFENSNIDLLNTVARAKIKSIDYNGLIENFCNSSRHQSSPEYARVVCKILNTCMPEGARIRYWNLNNIRRSHSKYFIEYLIERGLADELSHGMYSNNIQSSTSQEFRDALAEAGISIVPIESETQDDVKRRARGGSIASIIGAIINDDWSRSLEHDVTEDPDLLRNKQIQDAVNDHLSDSLTARQLKRRIDALPKATDTYDM